MMKHSYTTPADVPQVFYKAHGSAATWEWLEMIAPTVEVLRRLSKMFHASLGVDQGTKHAPAELSKDIKALMDNLAHYDVYVLKEGRVFDDRSQCTPDAVEIGFHALSEGLKSPLHEYNEAFECLQMRRRMTPVGRERTNDPTPSKSSPTTQPGTTEIKSESGSESDVEQSSRGSSSAAWDDDDLEEEDRVLLKENALYSGDVGEGDGNEAALARRTEADVAFDMDVGEVDDDSRR